MNRSLWDFAVDTYARTGVEAALLELQDAKGADVLLVLYALWLDERAELLSQNGLATLDAELGPWRARVVEPVRALRKQWRDFPEAANLREALKKLELDAERHQLLIMEARHAANPTDSRVYSGTNLDVLGQYWALDNSDCLALKAALALV